MTRSRLTELDTGVFLADLVALVVGEEHVGGKSTLGRVGVCLLSVLESLLEMHVSSPFFFLPASALVVLPLPRVDFSLGMMYGVVCDKSLAAAACEMVETM